MTKRRALLIAAVIAAVALLTKSCPPRMAATQRDGFTFAALGDAPYYPMEALRFRILLLELEANDVAFVLHVGDIFWKPCTDEHYAQVRDRFNALRHAVIYTPGDNEWADCWERQPGGFAPIERLALLRRTFFTGAAQSLGRNRIALVRQAGEFVENARWSRSEVVFATVHLVGSWNATESFAGRTAADDEAAKRRTAAAVAWMREAFVEARRMNARATVIAFHASLPRNADYRQKYEPFMTALEQEAAAFRKPVLVVTGDNHEFIADHPVPGVPNLMRLQVPGSPDVGWVRVTVRPDAPQPFSFESLVVPRWKVW